MSVDGRALAIPAIRIVGGAHAGGEDAHVDACACATPDPAAASQSPMPSSCSSGDLESGLARRPRRWAVAQELVAFPRQWRLRGSGILSAPGLGLAARRPRPPIVRGRRPTGRSAGPMQLDHIFAPSALGARPYPNTAAWTHVMRFDHRLDRPQQPPVGGGVSACGAITGSLRSIRGNCFRPHSLRLLPTPSIVSA